MKSIYELFISVVVALVWVLLYQNYWDDFTQLFLSGEDTHIIYLTDVALEVTVADEPEERAQGLSGVESLRDFEGKLFIFDTPDYYHFWMKDMLIPIDVLWFNDNLELVHIERNMTPETFPNTFTSDEPARFVLEMNAYFVDSLKIQEGDRLIVPPDLLPSDIRDRLQQ
jgi:uncharacterized membrane protein (UPF0127 family)